MANKSILLIGFYNPKALGVRFLERSLVNAGFRTYILFVKDFNSQKPMPITKTELLLLKGLVASLDPGLIGLSVMSSLYLDTVLPVNEMLRRNFNIPVVWGGVYASLFPGKCLEHADYVLRGEGEKAIVELADALFNEKPCHDIKNLAYHYNRSCRSRALYGNQDVNKSQAADGNRAVNKSQAADSNRAVNESQAADGNRAVSKNQADDENQDMMSSLTNCVPFARIWMSSVIPFSYRIINSS